MSSMDIACCLRNGRHYSLWTSLGSTCRRRHERRAEVVWAHGVPRLVGSMSELILADAVDLAVFESARVLVAVVVEILVGKWSEIVM
jgi:hypothetical protein